jgi:FkbM family methyltransferase
MLAELLSANNLNLSFVSLEVGALPVDGRPEPFHSLLRDFPRSRNLCFEVDEQLCARLNQTAVSGMEFHPFALGGRNGKRTFYTTAHPMCASLFEPDERWADLYYNLDVMRKTGSGSLDVITLEQFVTDKRIGAIDFIKADIQGAELEFLRGAGSALDSVLCVVCEVEFVPLYKDQPLFADIDSWLRSRGFMLHKLLGMSGRAMKPIQLNNDFNYPAQHMWSDAMFVRDLRSPERLSDEQLLKLAVYMSLYRSVDVSHYLLAQYDGRRGTRLAQELIRRLSV